MKHYGDITKLNGADLPVVDVITGGSPCQDLSVAGRREGLAGSRSGLFLDQIRIVKEMRQRDREQGKTGAAIRPRILVWENVPGAFSSNGGADFKAVLEEIVRIAEPNAPDLPEPEKGKWTKSGCVFDEVGKKWSLAWRVHDAQFWGVPQRRKRIAVVADFGGLSAPEVLFERKGMSWDPDTGGQERQEAAAGAGGGTHSAGKGGGDGAISIQGNIAHTLNSVDRHGVMCLNDQGGSVMGVSEDVTGALRAQEHGHQPVVYNGAHITSEINHANPKPGDPCHTLSTDARNFVLCAGFDGSMGARAGNIGYEKEKSPTLNAGKEMHVYDARGNGDGQTVPTITGDHENRITDYTAVCVGNGQLHQITMAEQCSPTLQAGGSTVPSFVAFTQNQRDEVRDLGDTAGALAAEPGMKQQTFIQESTISMDVGLFTTYKDIAPSQLARQYKDPPTVMVTNQETTTVMEATSTYACTVRRLTPLEAERLQGFPDGWTDIGEWTDSKGKPHKESSDTARYKALGNSIAIPYWKVLLKRISALYDRDATLGSLFDGIGGFPYIWEQINGKGSAVWASEIEEFPIAVTRRHFPEEEDAAAI